MLKFVYLLNCAVSFCNFRSFFSDICYKRNKLRGKSNKFDRKIPFAQNFPFFVDIFINCMVLKKNILVQSFFRWVKETKKFSFC